jgi:prevent-host-death family protein
MFGKVDTSSYFASMRSVGIKVLRNKLSEYLRLVASGETVLVTERNRVVAELQPPRNRGAPVGDAKWAELIKRGVVTPARNKTGKPPPRLPAAMTFEEMIRDLDESREDK